MLFHPANKVVALCAEGMTQEGDNDALALFQEAWTIAASDFERFIAAHYVARHQLSVAEKLHWDETALHHALRVSDTEIIGSYPSLYLNIAKCYEDLADRDNALKNYELARSFASALSNDGYSNMIRAGIHNGLQRMTQPVDQCNHLKD